MLDQLVESKSNAKENKTRGGYLLTTFMVVAGLLSSAFVYSLFAKDLGIGNNDFELSKLVAPLAVAENVPPEPVKNEPKQEQAKSAKIETIVRQTNTLRIDESPLMINKISSVPNTQKSRPNGAFSVKPDSMETGSANPVGVANGRTEKSVGVGISNYNQTEQVETVVKTPPPLPPVKKATAEIVEKKKTPISKGVVNGQAIILPKPPYPPIAKAVNANGAVNVQVTIDEIGNVISAKDLDGHPLLRQAAENAARNAKFRPTLLSDQPVKVTGIIVYKFATQ
jgi:TonB family protein